MLDNMSSSLECNNLVDIFWIMRNNTIEQFSNMVGKLKAESKVGTVCMLQLALSYCGTLDAKWIAAEPFVFV